MAQVIGLGVPARREIRGQRAVDESGYGHGVRAARVPLLMACGLFRLAGTNRQLKELDGELARTAVLKERLRAARDMHDLLGLGLSAVALKTDLIAHLIGRDHTRAAAEIEQLTRICATARADIRLVTGGGQRLSLTAELATARQILTSAGVQVHASLPGGPLPSVADQVLAPVLREAVTNILRHSTATSATIELAAWAGPLRLTVRNDGAARQAAGSGSGLANLTARVQAVGGWLASRLDDGRFELTAQIAQPAPADAGPVTGSAAVPAPMRTAASR